MNLKLATNKPPLSGPDVNRRTGREMVIAIPAHWSDKKR